MMLNEDYRDMLLALSGEKASFLLIGAFAMAVHGYPRATMDIDLWVQPTPHNAEAVLRSLRRFGAPTDDLTSDDLQKDGLIFQIGVAPRRIDIITSVSGLNFDDTFARSLTFDIDGIDVHVPTVDDIIRNKRASGRTRDLADAEALELLKGGAQLT
jgi:hypothetical protein